MLQISRLILVYCSRNRRTVQMDDVVNLSGATSAAWFPALLVEHSATTLPIHSAEDSRTPFPSQQAKLLQFVDQRLRSTAFKHGVTGTRRLYCDECRKVRRNACKWRALEEQLRPIVERVVREVLAEMKIPKAGNGACGGA